MPRDMERFNAWRRARRAAGIDKRGYVSAENRRLVMAASGGRCSYCGSPDELEVDHVVSVRLGGNSEPDNLQVLCKSCNSRKNWRDAGW